MKEKIDTGNGKRCWKRMKMLDIKEDTGYLILDKPASPSPSSIQYQVSSI